MQFSSLLGHTEELLGIIQHSPLPADSLIDSYFRSRKYLGSHDRKFIAETVYGTLRHFSRSEWIADQGLRDSGEPLGEGDRRLWTVVAYLAAVERRADIPLSDLALKTTSPVLKVRAGEVLALVRSKAEILPADGPDRIAAEYSFPPWMVESFKKEFGEEEAEDLCRSLNAPAPFTLRVNTLKSSKDVCRDLLRKEGVETTPTAFSPVGLTVPSRRNLFQLQAFRDGLFEVQDEGSQLISYFIDPKPTAKVLDACAGAGGKTLALAALMNNRGEIFAADINEERLEALQKRAKRAGVFNTRIVATEALHDRAEEFQSSFDVVLVDAPCTGLGTLRRNPGMKWTVKQEHVEEMADKQVDILRRHSVYVKPGGSLFYATCSLLRKENEDVVTRFLEVSGDFIPADAKTQANRKGLQDLLQNDALRLSPHRHNTDGFYCVVLTRRLLR